MAMLGGVNNTVGVIIGALLVDALPEIFRSLQNYMQADLGLCNHCPDDLYAQWPGRPL